MNTITLSTEAVRYLAALVEVDEGENAPSETVWVELTDALSQSSSGM